MEDTAQECPPVTTGLHKGLFNNHC